MFGVAVGAIAVSTTLFGSACAMYGAASPDVGAPDTGGSSTDGGPNR